MQGNAAKGREWGIHSARRPRCGLAAAAVLIALACNSRAQASSERIFTIANFPVEASAANAVAAKQQALDEGRQAAFRSLLKRLVPVTSYPLLKKLRQTPTSSLIDGVSVRSEQNSATDYIATLDFSFQPLAVRQLLAKEGVPFLEEIAPEVTLVPVLHTPSQSKAGSGGDGREAWREAWRNLDLQNTLTPLKLEAMKPVIHADTITALLRGDTSAMRIVTGEYRSSLLVMAVAEPQPDGKKLKVVLVGQDGVGSFHLEKIYGGRSIDAAYTTELAAVISQAIIEGRWKAVRARPLPTGGAATGTSSFGGIASVAIAVEFPQNLDRDNVRSYWWKARRMLTSIDGVRDLTVSGLNTDQASVTLVFPGGGQNLADELLRRGFVLRSSGGSGWRLLASERM